MRLCANLQRLRQWRDGSLELTASEEAELEVHVASCPQCSDLLQADEQTEKWRRLVSPNSDYVPPVGRPMLRLCCPHCHNPIQVVGAMPANELLCPSCGSQFQLDQDESGLPTPQVGEKTLGKFILLQVVGAGAFGTVYKARDPELDRSVAVKVPRAGNLGVERDRFLREARSVAQLRHPRIVPVYEVGQYDGVPYLISEFVEGITLEDQLKLRRPTPQEAASLMAAVADALHYSHGQGVVHRDLKPSNIMLDAEGHPRVMDFGMAKRDVGEITMTIEGQVLGTPAYMSPEQAKGEGHDVDGRSDVYSLGVMLYELLTGEIPFRGNSRMLLHQVLHDEPKPPRQLNDHVPRDLETICLKAMAKEPLRRYQTAGELRDDLARFLQGEPIKARPVAGLERLARWAKRNPRVATLSTAVLFLLLAGSAGSVVTAALALRMQVLLAEKQRMTEQQRETLESRRVILEKLLDFHAQVQPEPRFEQEEGAAPVTMIRLADDFERQKEDLREFLEKNGTVEDLRRFKAMLEPRISAIPVPVDEELTLPGVIVRVMGAGNGDKERPFGELTVVTMERPEGRQLSSLEELESELKELRTQHETMVRRGSNRKMNFFSRVHVEYDDRVRAGALMNVVRTCRRAGPLSVALTPLRDGPSRLEMPLDDSDVTPFEREPLPRAEVESSVIEGKLAEPSVVGPGLDLPDVPGVRGGSLGAGLGESGEGRGLPRPGSKGGQSNER